MSCLPDDRVGENGDWDSANSVMTTDNRTHYQVLGLQPYTVYSFRVLAVNTVGTSFPSKESYYMLTLREIPDGKADITKSGNASSTSVTIHWNAPERERMNGEFLGYRIKYWPRDDAEDVGEVSLRDADLRVSSPLHLGFPAATASGPISSAAGIILCFGSILCPPPIIPCTSAPLTFYPVVVPITLSLCPSSCDHSASAVPSDTH